jgi:hypothetical protein
MKTLSLSLLVIPAQAGIQRHKHIHIHHLLDSRLRGNDGIGFTEANRDPSVFIRRLCLKDEGIFVSHSAAALTARLTLNPEFHPLNIPQ